MQGCKFDPPTEEQWSRFGKYQVESLSDRRQEGLDLNSSRPRRCWQLQLPMTMTETPDNREQTYLSSTRTAAEVITPGETLERIRMNQAATAKDEAEERVNQSKANQRGIFHRYRNGQLWFRAHQGSGLVNSSSRERNTCRQFRSNLIRLG